MRPEVCVCSKGGGKARAESGLSGRTIDGIVWIQQEDSTVRHKPSVEDLAASNGSGSDDLNPCLLVFLFDLIDQL